VNRDKVYQGLKEKGINAIIHYSIPLHLQGAYRGLGYKRGAFPVAEKVAQEILSLPLHPYLKEAQIEFIVGQVRGLIG
jgi:dTDP-4-amino-4,6-dideoxygalactose transaminase